MKISGMTAALIHADINKLRRIIYSSLDGRTDMTKLKGAFRDLCERAKNWACWRT
jgi:hypothetical protein